MCTCCYRSLLGISGGEAGGGGGVGGGDESGGGGGGGVGSGGGSSAAAPATNGSSSDPTATKRPADTTSMRWTQPKKVGLWYTASGVGRRGTSR